jgi:YfiH family protein
MEWREANGVKWLAAELGGGARAAFTTRLGGVSEPPFDQLNLGVLTDDARQAVDENRRRLAAVLGHRPERIVFALQVHGTGLIDHSAPAPDAARFRGSFVNRSTTGEPRNGLAEADGHIVSEAGLAPLVFVADCLPVALRGPGGVAMLHAGWRGLAGGILAAGAEAVGATDAAVGPGIGGCCYEVGEEVLAAFEDLGPGVARGRMLDLDEVARRLLGRAGVERVESAGLCTSCHPELFFSHRRDRGRTGRQAGLAWIDAEAGAHG